MSWTSRLQALFWMVCICRWRLCSTPAFGHLSLNVALPGPKDSSYLGIVPTAFWDILQKIWGLLAWILLVVSIILQQIWFLSRHTWPYPMTSNQRAFVAWDLSTQLPFDLSFTRLGCISANHWQWCGCRHFLCQLFHYTIQRYLDSSPPKLSCQLWNHTLIIREDPLSLPPVASIISASSPSLACRLSSPDPFHSISIPLVFIVSSLRFICSHFQQLSSLLFWPLLLLSFPISSIKPLKECFSFHLGKQRKDRVTGSTHPTQASAERGLST